MNGRSGTVFFDSVPAGSIRETEQGYEFVYDAEYLSRPDAQPVSLTLPLRAEPYESTVFFPFFDGLIPEGWLLNVAAGTWKLNPNDRMGLLLSVCADSIGAVTVRNNAEEKT
ncbi:MAG TPA: phosphatidylinositol kinase [Treponema sp.]|nr:phosphatidylinositol kinase [Treponema sp.]